MSHIFARCASQKTAVCFLTRGTCKNVRQNLIPRATAYPGAPPDCAAASGALLPTIRTRRALQPRPRLARAARRHVAPSGCGDAPSNNSKQETFRNGRDSPRGDAAEQRLSRTNPRAPPFAGGVGGRGGKGRVGRVARGR